MTFEEIVNELESLALMAIENRDRDQYELIRSERDYYRCKLENRIGHGEVAVNPTSIPVSCRDIERKLEGIRKACIVRYEANMLNKLKKKESEVKDDIKTLTAKQERIDSILVDDL